MLVRYHNARPLIQPVLHVTRLHQLTSDAALIPPQEPDQRRIETNPPSRPGNFCTGRQGTEKVHKG